MNNSPLQKALDLTSNKIVSACAGAGKTFALSKRYCAIIDVFTAQNLHKPRREWLGFGNVLVITFTNKAAAEMSCRIYSDLHTLLQGKEIPELKAQGISIGEHIRTAPEEYKNWLRSTFSQNCIMTIDAFCGTVLRENAFLLGIDPQFKTSDELLAQKLYRETLNEFLNRQSKGLRPELKNILQFTDKQGIIKFFDYFEQKKVFLEEWLEFIESHTVEEIYAYWMENYLYDFDVDLLIGQVQNLVPFHAHIEPREGNTIAELKVKIDHIPEDSEPERRRYFMAEVLPFFLTGSNTYYSAAHYIQSKKSFTDQYVYNEFKGIAEALLELLPMHIPEESVLFFPSKEDVHSISVFKDLITLYAEFERAMRTTQLQKNYLTFNDVIIQTKKLLQENNDVRTQYADRFRHILVDEFQDTNNLRWEIIKYIASEQDSTLRKKGIFIVGDKKQSIYRFQQADVEVMNRAKEELENVAEEVLIEFNDNYRSSRKFIEHVINPLFRNIFTAPEYPFEASFEDTTFPSSRTGQAIVEDPAPVCDISIAQERTIGSVYTPALHAAHTAKQYLTWMENFTLDDNVFIGVLLRDFNHIHEYLRAFQEFDIPFQIIGEKNLFNQQEAYDLFHFISVLINPHDDAALIGLLRSPFFCAPDTLIYNCKNRGIKNNESVYSFLSREKSYNEIFSTLIRWRHLSQTLSVSSLLEHILTEDHREFGYIGEVGGRQHLANIDKLIHLIRELGFEGSSLQDMHDYLSYQIHNKSEEPQADLPSNAKVQIMTIHKAKGLEFPAVIIPELNNIITKSDRGNIFHSRIVEQGQIEVGISIKEGVDAKKSNFLELIKARDVTEQFAEDKRMFYVAVTRAKYRVALLADIKGKINKNSWLNKFVIEPLEFAIPPDAEDSSSFTPPSFWHYELHSSEDLQNILDQKQHTEKSVQWSSPRIQESHPRFRRVTPHDIMNSVFKPVVTSGDDQKRTDNEINLAFGSLFHAIIEKELWSWDEHRDQIENLARIQYPSIPFVDIEEKLKLHLENFTSSRFFSLFERAQKGDVFHEHHITGWLDNGQLFLEVNGVIDLLFKVDNRWYIVDFKTDRTLARHDAYVLQLQTYQWITKQLYGINAQAFLYYTATNTLKEVPFSERYFSGIFPDEAHPFRPSAYNNDEIDECILSIILEHSALVILNLTDYHSKKLIRACAQEKILTPSVHITTLDQIRMRSSGTGRRLTPEMARLFIKKASGEISLLDGTIDLLTDAFYPSFMNREEFTSSYSAFNALYQTFEELRKAHHYMYDNELLDAVIESEFGGRTVLLNGFFRDTKADFLIMQKIACVAQKFYYIDSFDKNRLKQSFDHSCNIWNTIHPDKTDTQTVCTLHYSIETELASIAQKIVEYHSKGIPFSKIRCAISSIDVYIPVIRQVFKQYGIPYRILAPILIIDQPLTTLLTGLLTIMLSSEHLTWQTISSVLLHSLLEENPQFFALDAHIRRNNIVYFSDIVHLPDVQNYSEAIHAITETISTLELDPHEGGIPDIIEKVASFLHEHGIDTVIEQGETLSAVFDKLQKIIQNTLETHTLLDLHLRNDDLLKEIKKQFKKAELPRKEGDHGVQIISYLETYGSSEEVLFVAGLADTYFPVPSKNNPFTKSIPHYEWQRSTLLLNDWLKRAGYIHFSCPLQTMTGDVRNPSILLEDFEQKVIPYAELQNPITKRQYYHTLENATIENPESPLLQRHSDYLTKEIGPFTGHVHSDEASMIVISASRMNHLVQCPMRYLFEDILRLRPLQYNEEAESVMQLGNVVHKALEQFGKHNGFEICSQDFTRSCETLFLELQNALKSFHVPLETDLFLQRLYTPYLNGLEEGDKNNLLVQLLTQEKKIFKDYTPISFEQEFGMHNRRDQESWPILEIKNDMVTLHFWGKIDKILEKGDHSQIIASDYKTGSAPHASEINEFWDVQPFIYYFVLQKHYPGKPIRFVYESTKDQKKTPLTINFYHGECHIKTSKSEYLRSEGEIIKLLLHYGGKVVRGAFTIREREWNRKPCDYCSFQELCRKNSQRLQCMDTDSLIQIISEEKS